MAEARRPSSQWEASWVAGGRTGPWCGHISAGLLVRLPPPQRTEILAGSPAEAQRARSEGGGDSVGGMCMFGYQVPTSPMTGPLKMESQAQAAASYPQPGYPPSLSS